MAAPPIIRFPLLPATAPKGLEKLETIGQPKIPISLKNQQNGFNLTQWVLVDTGADVIWMSREQAAIWNLDGTGEPARVHRISAKGADFLDVIVGQIQFTIPAYSGIELFSWPCLFIEADTPFVFGLRGLTTTFKIKLDSSYREDGRFPLGCLELELI